MTIEEIAKAMGAKIVTRLPSFGGGVLDAAGQGQFYARRMAELRANEGTPPENSMKAPLEEGLHLLAEWLREQGQPMQPAQIADMLLARSALEALRKASAASSSAASTPGLTKRRTDMQRVIQALSPWVQQTINV